MARTPTFPILYDECKTISIGFLKEHGYLKPDHWKSGGVTWSQGEGNYKQITGRISFSVFTYDASYLELDYKCNDKPINYQIPLISVPSNMGKGVVWFFQCPYTGKRCRKLYLADSYFVHRSAFRGCMYEKQTYSKQNRVHFKALRVLFDIEGAYDELNSKHFKKSYRGNPTKRYIKLMNQLSQGSKMTAFLASFSIIFIVEMLSVCVELIFGNPTTANYFSSSVEVINIL